VGEEKVSGTVSAKLAFRFLTPFPLSANPRYVTLGKEADILDQAERLLKLNAGLGSNGVRYAISNEAAANHFRTLLRTKFADQMDAGILKVFHVP